MRPSKKGWITNYIDTIVSDQYARNDDTAFLNDITQLTNDKKIYRLVQPSGLMYGHPVRPIKDYKLRMANWNEDDKMKFILLDCLLNEALLLNSNKIENKNDFLDCIHETMNSIFNFYQENLLIGNSSSSFHIKSKTENDLVESILNERVKVKARWTKNFWAGFFQNSLLFLDVYNFSLWYQKDKLALDFKQFHESQEKLRFDILQVIATAAWANNNIENEEKALFNFFLHSADLTKENELQAKELLINRNRIENINLSPKDPWIIKKYMLELAILTIWADKHVEEIEKDFIKQLSKILSITQEDLDNSLLAVESFVISNWQKIHFLQSKHDLLIIKDRFSKRLSLIVSKNKNAFVKEIKESRELMELLKKMTREKLSEKEKVIVKAQLLDILKTLPTFVIIALPGTFITLPLLLNLLPSSAFPSAFSEVD